MTVTGTLTPTTATPSTATGSTWTNPNNATGAANGTLAVWTSTTRSAPGLLTLSGYTTPTLDSADTVNSVTVTVTHSESTTATTVLTGLNVALLNSAGSAIGTIASTAITRSTSLVSQSFVFTGVTPAQLAGAQTKITGTRANSTTSTTVNIDAVTMVVDYTVVVGFTGTAALSGTGTLAATGQPAPVGIAALSGTGTLTTTGQPSIDQLVDDFTTADSAKWAYFAGASVSGGKLVLDQNGSATGKVESQGSYNLVGSAATVELAQAANDQTEFWLFINGATSGVRFLRLGTLLYAQAVVGGTGVSTASVTYDPVAHRWLRVREAGGVVYWDTSSDRQGWTQQHSWTPTISVASLRARLSCQGTTGTPSTAIFDNFNVAPKIGELTEDFADALDPSIWWSSAPSGGSAAITGGHLVHTAPVGGSASQYVSTGTFLSWRLAESAVWVQHVTMDAGPTTSFESTVIVQDDIDHRLDWVFNKGADFIGARTISGGAATYPFSTAYDPATFAFVRIRETGGVVYWDSSPDGTSWVNRGSFDYVAAGWTWRPVQFAISSGDWGTAGAGQTATWDSVNVVPAVFTGTAALSGSGTLTAAGVPKVARTAAFSGTGTLTAGGQSAVAGAGAFSGTGTLTATGKAVTGGTAQLSGTGTLSVTGQAAAARAVQLSGTGTLSAAGQPVLTASAQLSGTGTLAAGGQPASAGTAQLSGTGTLAVTGVPGRAGAAALSGTGTLVAVGTLAAAGVAALSGTGTLVAAAAGVAAAGTAQLSGTGTLSGAGTLAVAAPAVLSGSGTLAAAGTAGARGTAQLSGTGTLAAAPSTVRAGGTAQLSGTGSLTVSAPGARTGTAALSGTGQLSAQGAPAVARQAALSGTGTLAAAGKAGLQHQVLLSGTGTLAVDTGKAAVQGAAQLSGTGQLTTASITGLAQAVQLSGEGQLAALGMIAWQDSAALSGEGQLVVVGVPGVARPVIVALILGELRRSRLWIGEHSQAELSVRAPLRSRLSVALARRGLSWPETVRRTEVP